MRFCLSITWLYIAILSTGCLFPAALGTMGAVTASDVPAVGAIWAAAVRAKDFAKPSTAR